MIKPVEKIIFQMHILRIGEDNVHVKQFVIDFHDTPEVDDATRYISEVLAALQAKAIQEVSL